MRVTLILYEFYDFFIMFFSLWESFFLFSKNLFLALIQKCLVTAYCLKM